jgi:hypothetical protein
MELSALVRFLRPLFHGSWLDPNTDEPENDSHVQFFFFLREPPGESQRHELELRRIEEALNSLYFSVAVELAERSVYQRLVFVESWVARYVTMDGRYDLAEFVDRGRRP